jgi:type I restriction enzyme R subunit
MKACWPLGKIGGQARAMVVCSGIERAIQYFKAFQTYLVERKSPYQAIVAFSGEHDYGGTKVSESSLNGFASRDIADKIQDDPYRFLICADKFQTGYDEPLLHTMYVDKALSGIKAVQTLSRLNRAHPKKRDCFVLDFQNDTEGIKLSFQDYFRTTILSEETDPNKLNDQKLALDAAQVYTPEQVDKFVALFLAGAERDKLDPILDACVVAYKDTLDEDQQVDFKGKAKAFCRTYDFPGVHRARHQCELGKALHPAEPAGGQTARAQRRRPGQRHHRHHRHGQLPGGQAGGDEDRAGRQRRRH